MAHVLVTGHEGYVGPGVIEALKEAGHQVTGLDVGYFSGCVDDRQKLVQPDRMIVSDVRDVTAADLVGADAIVHLAGLSNDPMGELDSNLTEAINHEATIQIAKAAKSAGVRRFIFASSCSIYGAAGGAAKALDESATFKPESAYAKSKVDSERDLLALKDESFAPVFLRFATAFGLSPRMRFDLVLANLLGWARTTGAVKVLSDGTPWRPLVHVRDMALAIRCAVEAPEDLVRGRPFNIGRPDNNVQVRDLAETVKRQVSGSTLVITGEAGGDPRSYQVDFSRALAELPGFKPAWTIGMGCEQIDKWIVDRKISLDRFQSREFVRLKQLQHLRASGAIDKDLRYSGRSAA